MGRIQHQSRRCQLYLRATLAVIAVAGLGSLRAEPPSSFGLDPTGPPTDFDSVGPVPQEPPSVGSFAVRLTSGANSKRKPGSVTRHIAYWPNTYRGEKVFGGPGRELTDGRLALTVTAAEKAPSYDSYPVSVPRFPAFEADHEYRIRYAIKNPLKARADIAQVNAIIVDSDRTCREADTRCSNGSAVRPRELSKFVPAGPPQDFVSLTNHIHVINNLCVHVIYADKKETMFIVVIPDHFIRDMKEKP